MVLSRTHPFLTLVISEVAGLMKSKARNSIASALALVLLGLGLVSDGVSAQPQGGAQVSIESQDASGTHILLNAMLWTPPGTAKGAVVLVHGSSGWTDYTVGHYGRALSAAGYAALAFDAFGARGVGSTGNDQTQVTAMQMTRDAYAARQFLLGRGFKSDRLGVMGFSKGGLAAMQAADRNFVPEQTERFEVAIPFYPGCPVHPRVPKPVSKVFMGLGEKDDYTGVKPCQDLAEDYRRAGGTITVKVYPDASHGFDGNPENTRMIQFRTVENFMGCVVFLEEDGQVVQDGKRYRPDDAALVVELRKTCVTKGASMWTNQTQKAAATHDVIDFLDRTFGL